MTREQELAAALHWLRNHYDVGSKEANIRRQVLTRTEQILAAGSPVTGDMLRQLREKYPPKG